MAWGAALFCRSVESLEVLEARGIPRDLPGWEEASDDERLPSVPLPSWVWNHTRRASVVLVLAVRLRDDGTRAPFRCAPPRRRLRSLALSCCRKNLIIMASSTIHARRSVAQCLGVNREGC